jgi:hypothetical protein
VDGVGIGGVGRAARQRVLESLDLRPERVGQEAAGAQAVERFGRQGLGSGHLPLARSGRSAGRPANPESP